MRKLYVRNILGLFLWLPVLVNASVLPQLPAIEEYKVIQVAGEDVPYALGMEISKLSVAAVVGDVLEPIPFQIDEYNLGGGLYFDDTDVPINGTKDLLDEADKIIFLFKDAGLRKTQNHFSDGKVVAEIQLKSKAGNARYVYLVNGSKLRSEEQYVRYSSEHAHVETDFYSLTYDPLNHLKWLDFSAVDYIGDPPLDSMKVRLDTGLITGLVNFSLDNDQFVAKPVGELVGPIRSGSQQEVTLWYVGMPLLKISLQMHHYPQNILYDARVMVPEVRRKLMYKPSLSMSVEGNNLFGAEMRTALGPKQAGVVDGMIDETELAMIESGVDKEQNWIWVSTKRNLDLAAFFDYLGDSDEPIALHLMDSVDNLDPPERFPGQLPNLGYKILNFPDNGFFGFVVSMYVSKGYLGNPSVFMTEIRTAPEIKVTSVN